MGKMMGYGEGNFRYAELTGDQLPYHISPSFGSSISPFDHWRNGGDTVVVNVLFSSPVLVRIIPTSPFVYDITLYRRFGKEEKLKVSTM